MLITQPNSYCLKQKVLKAFVLFKLRGICEDLLQMKENKENCFKINNIFGALINKKKYKVAILEP